MPLYAEAPNEVAQMVNALIDQYHQPLRDCGATVDLLFAHAKRNEDGETEPDAVALKFHGYQCAAVVKVNSYKLRCQHHGDAEIVIDGDRWPEWSEEEQRALLDHELEHLEQVCDSEGGLKRDDLGRPRLRARLHDHQYGWFDSIVRRHGAASIEAQQARKFVDDHYSQYWLPIMDVETPSLLDERTGGDDHKNGFNQDVADEFRKAGILAEKPPKKPHGKPENFHQKVDRILTDACDEMGVELHRNVKVSGSRRKAN